MGHVYCFVFNCWCPLKGYHTIRARPCEIRYPSPPVLERRPCENRYPSPPVLERLPRGILGDDQNWVQQQTTDIVIQEL